VVMRGRTDDEISQFVAEVLLYYIFLDVCSPLSTELFHSKIKKYIINLVSNMIKVVLVNIHTHTHTHTLTHTHTHTRTHTHTHTHTH
jgi:hypothetical protein